MDGEEHLLQRIQFPLFADALRRRLAEAGHCESAINGIINGFRAEYFDGLREITEDSFAALCPNVMAGRIASFFDLHGPSYVTDAACASALAAIDCAVDGLVAGDFDMAFTGAFHAQVAQSIFVCFSKFRGLSRDRVKPFDSGADGFLLGEGGGIFILKRLLDARRDADRIYAVIRGIGSSSDGREKGIGAPNPKAQALAMQRAVDAAGISPDTIQFIETHGAGTPVGDPTEIEAMSKVYGSGPRDGRHIGLGAVKSQIGHLMGAAGASGMVKATLGLHHKILPPTIHHHALPCGYGGVPLGIQPG
jgi:acyl transferase domain-containing protein